MKWHLTDRLVLKNSSWCYDISV